MKSTILRGTLSGVALSAMLAVPAFAQTSSTSPSSSPSSTATTSTAGKHQKGCPAGFDAGDAAGVRICREKGGGFRLETTDPARSGAHEYTGTLTTDGSFSGVQLIRAESDDSASVDGNGNLNFDFKTYSGIDGMTFRATGGKEVTFNLMVDGQQLAPAQIWVGRNGKHPKNDPFKVKAGHHKKTAPATTSASASPSPAAAS
ncbi:MAG TPA: hypothetical protein VK009_11890 [Chloroflexota bacterium]|nr:hypothetical protein [Chloroflexota bacterium]